MTCDPMNQSPAMRMWIAGLILLVAEMSRSVETIAADVKRQPNVIVVLADDLGAKELGCYGHQKHRTPNLDRLAAEGMRFETCYATPICSSSRDSAPTGQYGFRNGWFNLIGRAYTPREDSPEYEIGKKYTIGDVAQSRGYKTALVGKWQLTGKVPDLIHECGFDEYLMWAYEHNLPQGVKHSGEYEDKQGKKTARYWHPCLMRNGKYLPTEPTDYGPDLMTDFAIDFARRHKDQPFLIYFPMTLTHSPHDPTPDPIHPGQKTEKGLKSNLEYLDFLMGRMTKAMDEMGLGENTVILFVGDNGTGGDGKGTVTERGARVPLIVRCPTMIPAGIVSRELTDLSDVLPTLAEFVGATLPAGHVVDGKSLVPTLRGGKERHREFCFSYLAEGRIIRTDRWLLEIDGKQGRFFDCGENRDGSGYKNVTDSKDHEVMAARRRFDELLKSLPGPEGHPGLKSGDDNGGGAKNKKRKKNRDLAR